jgi:hypothetical protein
LLLTIAFVSKGQKKEILVPSEYNEITFHAFADSIYQNYGLQFFYKPEWTVGLRMVIRENKRSLEQVLDNTFFNKAIFYFIDNDGNLILSKSRPILGSLPDSYFQEILVDSFKTMESSMFEDDSEIVPQDVEISHINIEIGNPNDPSTSKEVVISGIIKEKGTGEPVIGATIYSELTREGTVSNVSGQYFLKLKRGSHQLAVRCIGKKEVFIDAVLYSDGVLNVVLEEKITELKAVVVTSRKYHNIESTSMGLSRIDSRTLSHIPVIGETDVLKISLLLPGVQSVGEGTTGFNVRGGNSDQNLILIDKAPVFNPSHLMGFFSAFNAEIIRDFVVQKSVVPARMGGRLSSVMELNVKNGNKNKISGTGGISPLTGRMLLEGPIIKDKLSFLLSGRTTYSNWLLKRIDNESINKSKANFYDLNGKLDFELNKSNTISLSSYYSNDLFVKNDGDTTFAYSNNTINLEWKHKFNPRFLFSSNLIYSNYRNSITDVAIQTNAYKMEYKIDYYEWRGDFIYFLNNDHTLNYGINSIYYDLLPGKLSPEGSASMQMPTRR